MLIIRIKKCLVMLVIGVMFTGQATTALAWDSRADEGLDTHKLIAEQSVRILEKDFASTESKNMHDALNLLKEYMYDLKMGSVYPDFAGNTYGLYQDHFYEPYMNINYTGAWWYPATVVEETARDRVIELAKEAVQLWKENKRQEAVFKLGCALHFFGDLNEPHHTSVRLDCMGGPGTAHSRFETWVEENKESYRMYTAGTDTEGFAYNDIKRYDSLGEFLQNEAYVRAVSVNHYMPLALLTNSWSEWGEAADYCMHQAQFGSARVMYAFLREVTR